MNVTRRKIWDSPLPSFYNLLKGKNAKAEL